MMNVKILFSVICLFMAITACSERNDDPVERKVQDLLSKMTLDEKIGQMVQTNGRSYVDNKNQYLDVIRKGEVGSYLNILGAQNINEIQRVAVEESRLGIPLIIGRDVIHGFKTIFPIPLGMAATWNPEAAGEAMAIAAREAAAQGISWTFAPMIDVTWDPRWGRIAETCGEDPYLASQFAVSMVNGFQHLNKSGFPTIAACAKHYVGYGMSEAGRDYNTTYIPEALLRNVHLRPFKAASDAGVLTFMSAFNDLNGVPTSGNQFTLRTILRDEWKFNGFVVSDWGSVTEMILHGYCADEKEAAEKAILAGVDMEMASRSYFNHIKELLADGKITQNQIDECVSNILRVKFKLGLFDNPYVDEALAEQVTLQPESLEHARRVARESMVLLKNTNNVLPLDAGRKIALIGPMADAARDQLGTWVFDGDAANSITRNKPLKMFWVGT
jgi:beta-glucosidase